MKKVSTCQVHPNQKARKLCKNPECGIRVCTKCINEEHKGHKVIEVSALPSEVENVKDKFLKAKRSEFSSIKSIRDEVYALNLRLENIQRKEEVRADDKLKSKLLGLMNEVNEAYSECNKNISEMTDLAKQVIDKGTDEDYILFFETCKGITIKTSNIKTHKKTIEMIREEMRKMYGQNNVSFNGDKNSDEIKLRLTASKDQINKPAVSKLKESVKTSIRNNSVKRMSTPRFQSSTKTTRTLQAKGGISDMKRGGSVIVKSPTSRNIITKSSLIIKKRNSDTSQMTGRASLMIGHSYKEVGTNTEINAINYMVMKMVESKSKEYETQCKIKVQTLANVITDMVIKNWIQERKKLRKCFIHLVRFHI